MIFINFIKPLKSALDSKSVEFNKLNEKYNEYTASYQQEDQNLNSNKMQGFLASKMESLKKKWSDIEASASAAESALLNIAPPTLPTPLTNTNQLQKETNNSSLSFFKEEISDAVVRKNSNVAYQIENEMTSKIANSITASHLFTSTTTAITSSKKPDENTLTLDKTQKNDSLIKRNLSDISIDSSTTTSSFKPDNDGAEEEGDHNKTLESDFEDNTNNYNDNKINEEEVKTMPVQKEESIGSDIFKKYDQKNQPNKVEVTTVSSSPALQQQQQQSIPYSYSEEFENNLNRIIEERKALAPLNDDDYFILNCNKPQNDLLQDSKQKSTSLSSSSNQAKTNITNTNSEKISKMYTKAPSIDSIKSKTIVTPIELEPNLGSENLSKEINIIKLNEHENTNLVQVEFVSSSSNSFENADNLLTKKSHSSHSIVSLGGVSKSAAAQKLNEKINQNGENIFSEEDQKLLYDLLDWLHWVDHNLKSHIAVVGNVDETQQLINKFKVKTFFN